MACHHKFINHLNLEKISFAPETLIVGTFNPAWPETNTAQWFYGRTDSNYFWDILPRLYGQPSLLSSGPDDWKEFCRNQKIALTDIVSSIDDADPTNKNHNRMLGGFSDDAIEYNFDEFDFTDVRKILRQNPSIKYVYLTRGITDAFWRHLWNPVAHYCNHNNIYERKLLPPTRESAFHHEQYNKEHPNKAIAHLEDYLLERWRNEWHFRRE